MQFRFEFAENKLNTMVIDENVLNDLSLKAADSERLRMNLNLHNSHDDEVQRLLNALEPGTKMPVHRHKDTEETYVILRGKLEVLLYDDDKVLTSKVLLCPNEGSYGIHLDKGQWHGLNVLEKGTTIFEVKKGPYKPVNSDDVMVF